MTDRGKSQEKQTRGSADARAPVLEWVAAALGLLLTLGILGAIAWEAVKGSEESAPAIEVRVERIVPTQIGYVAEVVLRNRSSATGAAVEIEGELTKADGTKTTSSATLDYMPGDSTRRAGLFFSDDPRAGKLEVRALGYGEP